ncbi:hypothetical protein MN116_004733 [Schistosoma mekongi]|uniref:Uncharacterized protein n=1 Tax=Schistosoma mekongi TaxID=38744 RepID=A0AAE1ZDG0_SCHME|nr:hypothetical protein MN116_004733 [Schistosoma mekongi]
MISQIVTKQPESIQIKLHNIDYEDMNQHNSQIDITPRTHSSNNVHNYNQQSDADYNIDDDDDNDVDNSSEEEDINSIYSQITSIDNIRCCLMSACCETCTCCTMPQKCDTIYYTIQNCTKSCPNGCPTIVPKPEEEEWNFLPKVNARNFAMCHCCYSPGGIMFMKYLDILCCPLCPMWDICKGCDYGYRRYRIQVILDRYKDSHRRRYIPCI